jgi:multidrug efflux pump subunit AcrB
LFVPRGRSFVPACAGGRAAAADTPQIYLDINRDKAQVLGVKVSDIFNALQSTLGTFYVNDFNVFGRTCAA